MLKIQFEITTTAVEFNTTMALVALMKRCNFVSAGTQKTDYRSNETLHYTDNFIKGVPHLYY
jgi:hypothetical protein